MFKILANWILNALSLFIVSKILRGITLESFESALIAVVIIGLINALIKPILLLLTLPINILSLGLFTFVLNALLLILASNVVPGFEIDGLLTAILGSILLSLITMILQSFVR